MMTTTAQIREFSELVLLLSDRCDRCGAQAYVRATLPSGDLLLCHHHFAEHRPILVEQAITIDDYSGALSPQ